MYTVSNGVYIKWYNINYGIVVMKLSRLPSFFKWNSFYSLKKDGNLDNFITIP
jgi:hypothetical protein